MKWLALFGVAISLGGCAAEDYAREEGLVPQPINEWRAEQNINAFMDDVADGDYLAACTEHLTLRLILSLSAAEGTCMEAFESAAEEGGEASHVKVIGSDRRRNGLWVETTGGTFVMQGNRIAYFRP